MNNTQKILHATAGLAKVTDEINKCRLAGNATVGLATATTSKYVSGLTTAHKPTELELAFQAQRKVEEAFSKKAVNVRPTMR